MLEQIYEKVSQKSIIELTGMMETGELCSEELVRIYLERMEAYDEKGPSLHAVKELNPKALAIAKERDLERESGRICGPLHGIPVFLKDAIDTGDGTHTTCGAAALSEHHAKEDAFIVRRLREAGAIIMGKNHMKELYGMISTSIPNNYSFLGKYTRNPFGPDHLDAGGSSGGSAVSVAMDFTAAAIGTDTAGSIVEPAGYNGVVGYKPSVGLTSRCGILPITPLQDVSGPITRTVSDAALVGDVIIGYDENDPDTACAKGLCRNWLSSLIGQCDLHGVRIGIVPEGDLDQLGVDALKEVNDRLEMLKAAGAEVVEIKNFLPAQIFAYPEQHEESVDYMVMETEFKRLFDVYLQKMDDVPFRNLKEYIAWNRAHDEVMPFGQDFLEMIDALPSEEVPALFAKARKNDLYIYGERGIFNAFQQEIDVLMMFTGAGYAAPTTVGWPVISINFGYTQETGPVPTYITGKMMQDDMLFSIAYAIEQAIPSRPVPSFV